MTIIRPSSSTRIIKSTIVIPAPISVTWTILTDYNNLAIHVTNLVESRVLNNVSATPGSPIKLYQKGAQTIGLFRFGASLILSMTEVEKNSSGGGGGGGGGGGVDKAINFVCLESQFFSNFDGSWQLQSLSEGETLLSYEVFIKPRGPVPVQALEWRIKEDVPVNLISVSEAAKKLLSANERKVDEEAKEKQQPVEEGADGEEKTKTTQTNQNDNEPDTVILDPIARLTQLVNRNRKLGRDENDQEEPPTIENFLSKFPPTPQRNLASYKTDAARKRRRRNKGKLMD